MSKRRRLTKVRLWIGCAVLLTALIAAGVYVWEAILEDRFIPKRWGVVEPNSIYRSGQLSPALIKKTLTEHNISVVVNLTSEVPGDNDQEAERRAIDELAIEMFRYPLRGNGTGHIENYAKAIAAIANARKRGKRVLVHCAAGTQRTGGVVACYRVLVQGKPASFAYNELLQYDWRDTTDQVLLRYINKHMAELAQMLKQMGVIQQVPDPIPIIESEHDNSDPQARASRLMRSVAAGLPYAPASPRRLSVAHA